MTFRVVYADPAWPEKGLNVPHSGHAGAAGRADRHYGLFEKIEQVHEFDLPPILDDAWLFLWCPSRRVSTYGMSTMEAWGFKDTGSSLVWVKTQKNDAITELFKWWEKFVPDEFPPDEIMEGLAEKAQCIEPVYGMGYYARIAHEVLLIGKRGKPGPPKARNIRSVVHAPRGKHSEKPEIFAETIERYSDGPYVELFARQRREGWTCLGNEL